MLGVMALALVVVTSGCAPVPGDEPSGDPTPSVTTESPTPTPDPTKPAVAELLLSPDGLGPLVIGETPPSTGPDLDILVYDPDYCAGISEAPSPGMWLANYPVEASGHRPFTATFRDGSDALAVVAVFAPEILTERGIHLGSTRDEVLAAYPEGFASELDNDGKSTVYAVAGTVGQLLIEVRSDDANYWPPEELDRVNLLTVIPADESPFAVSGGDAYFWGECTSP
jgi:hypothetical protein